MLMVPPPLRAQRSAAFVNAAFPLARLAPPLRSMRTRFDRILNTLSMPP